MPQSAAHSERRPEAPSPRLSPSPSPSHSPNPWARARTLLGVLRQAAQLKEKAKEKQR